MPEINSERLDFQAAIDYFSQKANLDTDSYIEGQGIVQDAAFTVAAAKGDLLQDIRDAVAQGQAKGQSVQEFLKTFDAIADRYSDNWALKGNRAWRGQLIYDQNLRNAYQAGRYAQMTQPDVMKMRPYWQWRHGDSRDPRPVHLAMNGKVFPADSLGSHPPWGFSCRCTVFSLSERDLKRKGLKVEELSIGQDIDVVDKKGNAYTTKLIPDRGFEHTLGKSTKEQQAKILKRLEPDLKKAVMREAGMSWKPMMSKAEAEEYTRDSYYRGKDFYHGTTVKNADGIVTEGVKWSLDTENSYGDGFYMTPGRARAVQYANEYKDSSIVSARILCKNPKIFENGTDFYDFLSEYTIPVSESEAGFASRLLIKQGYDCIEIRGTQTLVIILNPQQVAVFKNERTT